MPSLPRLLQISTKNLKDSITHLLFPPTCQLCKKESADLRFSICSFCKSELRRYQVDSEAQEGPLNELFWGRVSIQRAFALLEFQKDSSAQTLLHSIKYKDQPELAVALGKMIGEELIQQTWLNEIEVLLPVPIHPKKEFMRGYNQSERIAAGIAELTNIPLNDSILKRSRFTESQTKQGRFQRWDNISNVFDVNQNLHAFKHVALVDDVVTTGSTLEKIALSLLDNNPDLRISIISLAIAV